MKPVFQTDQDGLYLYETVANELSLAPGFFNVPYGAVEEEPPKPEPGVVARWTGVEWTLVEDYRGVELWIVETGQRYDLRTEVEFDGTAVSYPGWGEVPAWLTAVPPEPLEA
ncbi:hypothetical protein [Bordetella bronchiseptica]|uniref:hypothetical protein n=1 Tax=Bordetella bronchiseptica TaxID=518 RepID=UPI000461B8EB|nr:hypothetical protein [Bordetella bronchiseptica]KDD41757.1 hypothetical protein L529_3778 [Bordetella bronchiseptica MBORD901]